MSDASGDPLYRSDTRAAPSGAQQADLAPVSDQPAEHWEQQAAQRQAEAPADAPADPLGAQPQAADNTGGEWASPGNAPQDPTPSSQVSAVSAPASPPAQGGAASPHSRDYAPAEQAREGSSTAALDHNSTLALGGQMAWSDPGGDHVRSGEISVDLAQATTVGGELGLDAPGHQAGSVFSALMPSQILSGTEPALSQAAASAHGVVGTLDEGNLPGVLEQATEVSNDLGHAFEPALHEALTALDELSFVNAPTAADLGSAAEDLGNLPSDVGGLATATGPIALASGPLPDLLSDQGSLRETSLDLTDGSGSAPGASPEPPVGLLASLFTPVDTVTPNGDTPISGDGLPDIELGGLLGSSDDHPDPGHLDL